MIRYAAHHLIGPNRHARVPLGDSCLINQRRSLHRGQMRQAPLRLGGSGCPISVGTHSHIGTFAEPIREKPRSWLERTRPKRPGSDGFARHDNGKLTRAARRLTPASASRATEVSPAGRKTLAVTPMLGGPVAVSHGLIPRSPHALATLPSPDRQA